MFYVYDSYAHCIDFFPQTGVTKGRISTVLSSLYGLHSRRSEPTHCRHCAANRATVPRVLGAWREILPLFINGFRWPHYAARISMRGECFAQPRETRLHEIAGHKSFKQTLRDSAKGDPRFGNDRITFSPGGVTQSVI